MTRARVLWTVTVAAAVVAVAVVGLPVWLIQPFAPQTPDAVALSWQLRRAAPGVTGVLALVVIAAVAVLWSWPSRERRRLMLRRTALVVIAGVALGAAWFARQNHFEWMFRPFPDPRFVAAAETTDVPAGAPVLGIASGEAALAFPITRLGYHHLVNATLGDVPIVATY